MAPLKPADKLSGASAGLRGTSAETSREASPSVTSISRDAGLQIPVASRTSSGSASQARGADAMGLKELLSHQDDRRTPTSSPAHLPSIPEDGEVPPTVPDHLFKPAPSWRLVPRHPSGAAQRRTPTLQERLATRPMTVRTNVMGAGAVSAAERPALHPGLHPIDSGESLESTQTLVDGSRDLARRTQKILSSNLEELPDPFRQPQRSRFSKALHGLPGKVGIRATNVIDLVRRDEHYAGTKKGKTTSQDASAHYPQARQTALLKTLSDSNDAHAAALARFEAAQTTLSEAQDASSSAGADAGAAMAEHLRGCSESRDKARADLAQCKQALRAAVSASRIIDASAFALASDLVREKVAFVQQRLADKNDRLARTDEGLGRTGERLHQHLSLVDEALQLSLADVDLANAEHAVTANRLAIVGNALDEANGRREALQAGAALPTPLLARIEEKIARLGTTQGLLNNKLADTRANVTDKTQAHAQLAASLASVKASLREEMRGLNSLRGRVADAVQALSAPTRAVDARVVDTAQAAADLQRQLDEFETRGSQALAKVAPGFDPAQLAGAGGQRLMAMLAQVAAALPLPEPGQERVLPRPSVIDILSVALAGASGRDPTLAAGMLQQVMAHPPEHWVALPEGGPATSTHAAPSDALRELWRNMAEVPRGLEVLDLAAQAGRGSTMDGAQRNALQTYWIVDKELGRPNLTAGDRTWLADGLEGASRAVRNTEAATAFDLADMPLREQVAFTGVSKGFLSREPGSDYHYINQMLRKPSGEWLDELKDDRAAVLRPLPKSADPAAHRTPFSDGTLQLGLRQMESQGMSTTRTVAADAVVTAVRGLGAQARAGLMQAVPGQQGSAQARQFDAVTQVVCEFVANHHAKARTLRKPSSAGAVPNFSTSRQVYDSELNGYDLGLVKQAIASRLGAAQPRGATPAPLPEPFQTLFAQPRVRTMDLLKAIEQHLRAAAALPQDAPALQTFLEAMAPGADGAASPLDKAIGIARKKRFDSVADIENYFRPMLDNVHLRDQVSLNDGGTIGASIPFVPYVLPPPGILSLTFNLYSRRKETFFQVKNPTMGLEFRLGESDTRTQDVKVTGGLGLKMGLLKVAAPQGGVRAGHASSQAKCAVFTVLREKDEYGIRQEKETTREGIAFLDTMLRWNADDKQPPAGEPRFGGPFEAVLARHPKMQIALGATDGSQWQGQFEVRSYARAGIVQASGGVQGGLVGRMSLTSEVSHERTGHAHQFTFDRSDQRQQVLAANVGLSALGSEFREYVAGGDNSSKGGVALPVTLNLLDFSRDLAQHYEKTSTRSFPMGDKLGSYVDNTFDAPTRIEKDIEEHRENYLMRCLELLPAAKGEPTHSPQRFELAEKMLKQYETDLRSPTHFPNMQFNRKYEAQPRFSGVTDAVRALQALAAQQNDPAMAIEQGQDLNRALQLPVNWSFKNTVGRSKAQESDETGVDLFVRWLHNRYADSVRAPMAFPG